MTQRGSSVNDAIRTTLMIAAFLFVSACAAPKPWKNMSPAQMEASNAEAMRTKRETGWTSTPGPGSSDSVYPPRQGIGAGGRDFIESQIDGDFDGWEGETIVKLTNGQIWQQSEYYYHYHYAFMPSVTIFRAGIGHKMIVAGTDRAVGVTQLR